jgi:outer membrane protein OmpA-like peptidoglycan-associated protein
MNTSNIGSALTRTLIATAVSAILLAGCATTPVQPNPAAEARNKLTQLQSDPNLATRAPQSLEAADAAVRLAEQPEADKDLVAYRVYLADRKVDIARADAQTRYAEDQRATITAQRDQARLAARTREANIAERQAAVQREAAEQARGEANAAVGQAAVARAEGDQQRLAADQARGEANVAVGQAATARGEADVAAGQAAAARDEANTAAGQVVVARAEGDQQRVAADQARGEAVAANQAAAGSAQQVAELQLQVQALQARPTERGLVLTLGDALFSSGRADLQPGATGHLTRLVTFLNKYPDRTVVIEGYTDNHGNADYNQGLSERRAGAVRAYLLDQGVSSMRLTSFGKGASDPVAGNDTASGRQQNRRVEVIISNSTAAQR